MSALTVQIPDSVLDASGKTTGELEGELRLLLALKLFSSGSLSLGKAAELASLPKLQFMSELARQKIPVINLADDQIVDELRDA